jgi:peptidoglycan/LPS O-acetylase OafA/YrhL
LPLESLTPISLLGNLLFVQDFKVPVYGSNGPLWSLAFEFWYYMTFIAAYNLYNFRTRSTKCVLGSVFILLVATQIVNSDWYFLGATWISGALTRMIIHRYSTRKVRVCKLYWLIVVVTVPTLVTLSFAFFITEIAGVLLVTLLTCVMIIYLANVDLVVLGNISQIVSRFIFNLSNSSFSLYAFHFPLLALVARFFYSGPSQRLSMATFLANSWVILLVYFVCYLVFFCTEKNTSIVRVYLSNRFKLQLDR